jgi:ribosomal protein S10
MKFKHTYQLRIKAPHHSHALYIISYFLYILTHNKITHAHICITHLPKRIKKFTVLKSPHVHKTARTQLELRTDQTLLCITNLASHVNQSKLGKIIAHLLKSIPLGIRITATHYIQQFI